MPKRRKGATDAPSTLKDPDYAKKRAAQMKIDKSYYDSMCGPVTVTKMEKK